MDPNYEKAQPQYQADGPQHFSQSTPYRESSMTPPAPSYHQPHHVTSAVPTSMAMPPQQQQQPPHFHDQATISPGAQPVVQQFSPQLQPQQQIQQPIQQQWPQQQQQQPQIAMTEKTVFVQQQEQHQAGGPPQFRQAIPIPALGRSSAPVDCPSCGQRKMTVIAFRTGDTTHLWAGILCCLTGVLGVWIPYVTTSFKDVEHRCANCGILLATWHKSGSVEAHAYA